MWSVPSIFFRDQHGWAGGSFARGVLDTSPARNGSDFPAPGTPPDVLGCAGTIQRFEGLRRGGPPLVKGARPTDGNALTGFRRIENRGGQFLRQGGRGRETLAANSSPVHHGRLVGGISARGAFAPRRPSDEDNRGVHHDWPRRAAPKLARCHRTKATARRFATIDPMTRRDPLNGAASSRKGSSSEVIFGHEGCRTGRQARESACPGRGRVIAQARFDAYPVFCPA